MHPYADLPDTAFWTRSVSQTPWRDLDLVLEPKFRIEPDARIAAAGSCFAQHITRYLKKAGIDPYVVENAHPLLARFGGDTSGYGEFSARYGNIYTSRQCLELFRQAFGILPQVNDFAARDGRWHDLLRPRVEPSGFASETEAIADRAFHLSCVRRLFESLDIFIFTLGLTERWYHTVHGHTYPACPGTIHGNFDPAVHRFSNLTHGEVSNDLTALIEGLAEVNPKARVILTVSPVPLVATRTQHHVLTASVYSKSVLRAAVGDIVDHYPQVAYFPSYEIISHPASFGQYLATDLREVTERGVSHVMNCFISRYVGHVPPKTAQVATPAVAAKRQETQDECEEMFNEFFKTPPP